MQSNEELVVYAKQNDINALDALWQNNSGLIFRLCIPYANNRRPIEDLMQEAYFGIVAAVQAFEPKENIKFTTYLTNSVKWHLIKRIKQDRNSKDICILDSPANKTQPQGASVGELLADDAAEYTDNINSIVDTQSLFNEVKNILYNSYDTETAKSYYKIICLYFYHNATYKKIADIMSCTINDVQYTINRILRLLRLPHNRKLYILKEDIISLAHRHVRVKEFKTTFTSSTEKALINSI